ncbi:MAG TPA: GIY-YIG nuclease family protein [Nitrospira sp.]|nr:GIY-YIG nuclease family protein [Nitrospira sp.]
MKFIDLIRTILHDKPEGATPQQIRDQIKAEYPGWYGTDVHRRNVEKGHYNNLDHALLAEIYIATRQASDIYSDRATRPMTLTLESSSPVPDVVQIDDSDLTETEDLNRLEQGAGTLYVLGTNLYTKGGAEIVKIGITTGNVNDRIKQLYTTGVPTKFRVIQTFDVQNYAEIEQALHKLLDPYRINRAREFFTELCLPYIDRILAIHLEIQRAKTTQSEGDAQPIVAMDNPSDTRFGRR